MATNIRIPTPLRKLTGEQEVVQADGSTVGDIALVEGEVVA